MGVEMGWMGSQWICYGKMPALTRIEGTLVPVEPVRVTTVVEGFYGGGQSGNQTVDATIHNNFPKGRVLLGVIGGYPLRPSRETASRILNMRSKNPKPNVVGHFPGPKEDAAAVIKDRKGDSRIAEMMYRNSMFPESVPTLMTPKEYAMAVAEGSIIGRNVRIIMNATEGTIHRQLMESVRVGKGKAGKGKTNESAMTTAERKRALEILREPGTYGRARHW